MSLSRSSIALLLGFAAQVGLAPESAAQAGRGIPRSSSHASAWRPGGRLAGTAPIILDLAETAAAPDRVYALSMAGLLRSDDAGRSFDFVSAFPTPGEDYASFAVSPTDPDLVLLCQWGQGIWRSEDGGATWARPDAEPAEPYLWSPSFSRASGSTVYVLGRDGAFRSDDGGRTFTEVLSGLAALGGFPWHLAADAADPAHVYLNVHDLGVYETTDAGDHWTLKPYPSGVDNPLAFALDPSDGRHLLLGDRGVVQRSTDAGATWSASSGGFPADAYIDRLHIDSRNGSRCYAGLRTYGLGISDDGGDVWVVSADSGLDRAGGGVRGILASSSHPGVVLLGDKGGLFRSRDGAATFRRVNGGLAPYATILDVAVDPFDDFHVVALAGGSIGWSTDGGRTFAEASAPPRGFAYSIAADAVIPDRFYVGTFGSELHRSDDGGRTFHVAGSCAPGFGRTAVDPAVAGRLYVTGLGLVRSDDGGATFTDTGLQKVWTWALGVSAADPAVIFVGTSTTLYRTLDGGATWSPASLPPAAIVREIACDPLDPDVAYAAAPLGGFFRTDDRGDTWVRMADELTLASAVHLPRAAPGVLLANALELPVALVSFDGGATVHDLSLGLLGSVRAFDSNRRGETFAATSSAGVMVRR